MKKVYKVYISKMNRDSGFWALNQPLEFIPLENHEQYGYDTIYGGMGGAIDPVQNFPSLEEAEETLAYWLEALKEDFKQPRYSLSYDYQTHEAFIGCNPFYEIRAMYTI